MINMKKIKKYIDESLIKSYDSDILLKKIKNKYKDKINDIHIQKSKSNIQSFSIQFNKEYINDIAYDESLYKLLDLFGYYITEYSIVIGEDNVILRFEPIFGQKCNDLVYNDCNGIIFHITKSNNLPRIRKRGLIPIENSSYRNFTERTFYSCGKDKQEIIDNINDLTNQITNKTNYTILLINLNKYHYNVDFYYDPSEDDTHNYIYANALIFPHMIEEIGTIDDLNKYFEMNESYETKKIFNKEIKIHYIKNI